VYALHVTHDRPFEDEPPTELDTVCMFLLVTLLCAWIFLHRHLLVIASFASCS